MQIVIRVGKGQTAGGKILDRETQWFHLIDNYQSNVSSMLMALEYHDQTGKPMFISKNGRKYEPLSQEQLNKMIADRRC